MSTDPVKEVLQNTIDNYVSKPSTRGKVIAVNGLWGTGKTYLWQSFFKEQLEAPVIPIPIQTIVRTILLAEFIFCLLLVLVIYKVFPSLAEEFYWISENSLSVVITSMLLISLFYWIGVVYYRKKLRAYSYISLFGINSLDDFKLVLFQNRLNITSTANNQFLLTPLDYFQKKILPMLAGVNFIFFRLSFKELANKSFNSVSHTLICIDDLERRGNNLDIKDIMGLVSFLKEQKQCTIVLLYNHEAERHDQTAIGTSKQTNNDALAEIKKELQSLKDEVNQLKNQHKKTDHSTNDFSLLLEKVVDKSFLFQPTTEVCINIAFTIHGNLFYCEEKYQQEVIECINRLELKNIRIILLIIKVINDFIKELGKPVFHKCVVKPLVYFVCCYYEKKSGLFPNLDQFVLMRDENFHHENLKEWEKVRSYYGLGYDPNLFDSLINYIKAGYLSNDNREKLTPLLNNKFLINKSEDSQKKLANFLNKACRFTVDMSELRALLEQMIEDGSLYLGLREYDHLISLVKAVWGNELSNDLIKSYIQLIRDNQDVTEFLGLDERDIWALGDLDFIEGLSNILIISNNINKEASEKNIFVEFFEGRIGKLSNEDLAGKPSEYYREAIKGLSPRALRELEWFLSTQDVNNEHIIEEIKKILFAIVEESSKDDQRFKLYKFILKDTFNINYDDEKINKM